jgi:uncharacterized protein YbjQ (UPF0145 family)
MSSEKKDLTRIEDLGEFIHELNEEEDFLPDLPSTEEEDPSFEESSLDFGTTEEAPAFTETTEEESSSLDFGSDTIFDASGDAFNTTEETTDFGSTFGSESEETPAVDFGSDYITFGSDSILEETPKEEPQTASWNTDVPLTEESEPESVPEPETVFASTPEPAPTLSYTPDKEYKTPETFEDLKKFSESSSFTGMATEGNPSFSVLIKNVRFIEDVNDIISLLRELNLLMDPEEQVKGRLMRGMLLVPRVSEFAAIFLSHKLRRFDVDIQVGLSDEIHPPKHQETPETGIVSKFNLYQNQTHHFHFDDPKLEISQIIVAATPALEGYQVLRYMGVASEHKMLDSHIVEDADSNEVPRHYQELANKLKAHALKAHSNAVVGLNYQLTPIPSEFGMGGHKYRLTCTGNLVWVNKL